MDNLECSQHHGNLRVSPQCHPPSGNKVLLLRDYEPLSPNDGAFDGVHLDSHDSFAGFPDQLLAHLNGDRLIPEQLL